LDLGGYTAHVAEGKLVIRGPQPLAGPLRGSVKANRDHLVALVGEWCGGEWPGVSAPRADGTPDREAL
jgi:hypothetical protein